MKKWWQRLKQYWYPNANFAVQTPEGCMQNEIQELSKAVKRWQRIIGIMRERCELDYDVADASSSLLLYAELLVPYVLVVPQSLRIQIIHLVGEDISRLFAPYVALPEEERHRQRQTMLRSVHMLTGEARGIIENIQRYEADAFSSEAGFVQAWYGRTMRTKS